LTKFSVKLSLKASKLKITILKCISFLHSSTVVFHNFLSGSYSKISVNFGHIQLSKLLKPGFSAKSIVSLKLKPSTTKIILKRRLNNTLRVRGKQKDVKFFSSNIRKKLQKIIRLVNQNPWHSIRDSTTAMLKSIRQDKYFRKFRIWLFFQSLWVLWKILRKLT
jgi:hypothetical protein